MIRSISEDILLQNILPPPLMSRQQRKKNNESEKRKYFTKCKEKFLQRCEMMLNGAMRRGAYLGYVWVVDEVGIDLSGVDGLWSGARSWDMCTFPLVMFYCLPEKSEK